MLRGVFVLLACGLAAGAVVPLAGTNWERQQIRAKSYLQRLDAAGTQHRELGLAAHQLIQKMALHALQNGASVESALVDFVRGWKTKPSPAMLGLVAAARRAMADETSDRAVAGLVVEEIMANERRASRTRDAALVAAHHRAQYGVHMWLREPANRAAMVSQCIDGSGFGKLVYSLIALKLMALRCGPCAIGGVFFPNIDSEGNADPLAVLIPFNHPGCVDMTTFS
jgi:hypothetical protein